MYSNEEFENSSANSKLLLKCENCERSFSKRKAYITSELNRKLGECCYCSRKCKSLHNRSRMFVTCEQCKKQFEKISSQIRADRNFCTRSCAGTYNNTHKTKGTRRSKLEEWLEIELVNKFGFIFKFNEKEAIGSELDIYVPDLRLGFELNGIFHYEPIFGNEKLKKIQNNDLNKFSACVEKGISLCIIDVSGLKYFKANKAKQYLDIIINIIEQKQALG